MLRLLVVLTGLLVLLSGCAAEDLPAGQPVGSDGEGGAAGPGTVTPKSGLAALIVIVTTTELLPVPGAQVSLADTTITALTDAGGKVVFNDLEPGGYTVIAAKPGYRSLQSKGRLVTLEADQVTELKLELDPVPVVDAAAAYHRSTPYKGFIGCGFEWRPPTASQTSRTHPCRGVPAAGTMVGRDPNENSIHPWVVESIQLQTILLEATWKPTIEAFGTQLFIGVSNSYECSATACNVGTAFVGGGGPSPLIVSKHEGNQALTAYTGRDVSKYPRNVWSEVRSYCPTTCYASPTLQQGYELWVSVFYGQEAPAGFSALAK